MQHQVYAPGFKSVLSIPSSAIRHLPPANLNVTRLVLCANFDSRNPESSCPMGDRCKFVHADVSVAREHNIHVNYAWRSLEEVTYERFPAGQILRVAPPNSKIATDVMDSDLALKTKALTSTRRPLSHCAHYYFNRTCNLGADCQFVHAVFIDPNAKQHQRAPVPSKLGEGRELQLSKKQRDALRGSTTDLGSSVNTETSPNAHGTWMSTPERSSCGSSQTGDEIQPTVRVHVPVSSASSCKHHDASHRPMRFRHDPYSLSAPRIVMCTSC